MKRKCIIFDIDGTLFDTKKGIIDAIDDVLSQYGMSKIRESNKYIGPPIKESFIKYHKFKIREAEVVADKYRKKYIEKYINESKIYDGVETVLQTLKKKGYLLGIATMKTSAQIDKLFEMYPVGKFFDVIKVANEDGTLTKSRMLEEIKDKYLSIVDDYYMVGDTLGDYDAAARNGYDFILADYGYGEIDDKEVMKIETVVEIIEKLL